MSTQADALRRVIDSPAWIAVPGVFDGFSARLAARAGACVLHASGGAISRAIGHPDIGLVAMTEMLGRIAEIAAAGLPVFAYDDTGYGNELNAARAASCYRTAGVAGLHVEDQTFPKRCGNMDGVAVIPAAEMAAKILATKEAVGDDLLICACTDAIAAEGLGPAIQRMRLHLDAGADMGFVEGIATLQQVERIAAALPGVPLVFNQAKASRGGAIALDALAANGVRLALYPGDIQRAAACTMQTVSSAIMEDASTTSVAGAMLTNAERDALFDSA